jgi:hypothetical protein
MKRFLLSLFITLACTIGVFATNILTAKNVSMEGPTGMSYNAEMSHNLGMDVFVSHDQSTAFAIGDDTLPRNGSASAMMTDLAKRMNINSATIKSSKISGGTLLTAHTDSGERTVGIFSSTNSNKVIVILIMGAIPVNEAIAYMKTLKPTVR